MNEKADKYFELLHPEYETLTPGEQLQLMSDKRFIEENIDKIDEMYTTYLSQAERQGEDINEQEIIATAVNLKKADKYFELLHPEYETLTPGEQLKTMSDKSFIEEHIDEIDKMYTTYLSQAERNAAPIDEAKFAEIYDKAKGKIKEVVPEIKSLLNEKSKDKNDKTRE